MSVHPLLLDFQETDEHSSMQKNLLFVIIIITHIFNSNQTETEKKEPHSGHGFHKAWVECVHPSVSLSVALPPDKLMHIRFVFDYLELI